MQLRQLLNQLGAIPARLVGDDQVELGGVAEDSRSVTAGDLFVAVPGRTVDGHDFVAGAIERGAVAVCVERELPVAVPQLIVPSASRALGWLAAAVAGRPADRMTLVGITGTNGKTTTSFLLEAILGQRTGVIGTVDNRFAGRKLPSTFTTPTPVALEKLFSEMAAAACTHVVLEATSSALAMDRLEGVTFRAAGFTNLTQDHLEVHGTMEAYFEAKARLFSERLAPDGVAAAMIDDPRGEEILARAPRTADRRRVTAIPGRDAEVRVVAAEASIRGVRATIATPRGELEVASRVLLGQYNVANLALAVALADGIGIPHEQIARGIAALPGVPGRVERVANQRHVDLFVDYAHTPDALERVLGALRPLTRNRLICVFGCGGDRDPTKRPIMGRIAARDADLAIVTSDNPRTEDPAAIVAAIVAGMAGHPVVEVDRRKAIGLAVAAARPGDVILVAGKGHEDYQILGKTKIHFDDREEAAAAIAALPPATTLAEIRGATEGNVLAGAEIAAFGGVTIDGRGARPGDLYVAVRGERHDGHDFCAQAAAAGATGFLVERPVEVPGAVVQVADTRLALARLGRAIRRRWDGPLVGVTGSTGKTTTKQLVAAALGVDVLATEGSLNNETGLPLTLCQLRPHHRYAVCEMGMRGAGQIDFLAQFAEPDVGVVVNVGVAHLEQLGSTDAIVRAKAEIWGRVRAGGAAVFPDDDPRLPPHIPPGLRRVSFGWSEGATVRIVSHTPRGAEGSDAELDVAGRRIGVYVPLVGRHNVGNAACALAVAHALGLAPEQAAADLARARPAKARTEVTVIGGRQILVDCYNANPASMRAGLDTLSSLGAHTRKLAVVGDMLELGEISATEHAAVGRHAAALGVSGLIALGERARATADAAREAGVPHVLHTDDPRAAARAVVEWASPGDWVLVKASRGMRLERVVDALREIA